MSQGNVNGAGRRSRQQMKTQYQGGTVLNFAASQRIVADKINGEKLS